MTLRLPQALCALAAATALTVAGCGGGDDEPQGKKLPASVTQGLQRQLESVGDRVAAGVSGACDDIYSEDPDTGNIGPIDEALASIPSDVDPEIRTALEQSIERLNQLVGQECDQIREDEQGVTETETIPTETVTTETETVPTETTETAPTTPEPPPTTPTPPDTEPNGVGPDGQGPPGQERGGAEAPEDGE